MSRKFISCLAAFALMVGATLATSNEAEAGHGLLRKIHCKKVAFFQKLKNRGGCCQAAPVCCEPAPEPCCAPEPAPEPCCAAEPVAEPCGCEAEAAPVADCGCGGEAVMEAPMMPAAGESVMESGSDEGFDLAPGEELVPGSVQTIESSEAPASEEVMTEEAPMAEAVITEEAPMTEKAPMIEASDAPESSSDVMEKGVEAIEEAAPPMPKVEVPAGT